MTDLLPPTNRSDDFEVRLRAGLHRLADAAPTTVVPADQVDLATVTRLDDRRGGRRRAAGIGGTIALVAGAVGVGAVAFNAATDGGGAGTPEEAVVTFLGALDHEDVLGVLEIVDPSEVAALRPVLDDATAAAERLELLDEAFALDGIGGVDVTTEDVVLRTDTLGPDLATVTATAGTLGITFDPSAFPFGDVLAGSGDGPTSATTDLASVDPSATLATVRRDGRWYVSASYTVAELARTGAGLDLPSGPAIEPVGADSPEAAALQLYERLLAGDLAGAIATAAPGDGDALRAYAELWVPAAQEVWDRELANGLDLRLDTAAFGIEGEGSHRTVRSASFTLSGTVPADWSSTDDMGFEGDPTLPTLVTAYDGSGWAVIPAGEPVPATVDVLEWTPWDQAPPDQVNFTYANEDGTIMPVDFPDPDAAPPTPIGVRVERAEGCTTFDAGAAEVMGFTPDALDEGVSWATTSPDGSVRVCGDSPAGAIGLVLLVGGGLALDLPTVATVEVDGRWYVSPIGTVAATITDELDEVEAAGNLLDSGLAYLVYGTNRASLAASLSGVPADDLTPACAAVAVTGPGEGGTGEVVTGIVDDPSPADARACQEDVWTISSVEVSGDDGVIADDGTVVFTAETVPASTAAP